MDQGANAGCRRRLLWLAPGQSVCYQDTVGKNDIHELNPMLHSKKRVAEAEIESSLGDLQPRDQVKRTPRAYDANGRSREMRARVDNILDRIRAYASHAPFSRQKIIKIIAAEFGRTKRTVRDDMDLALEDVRVIDNGDSTVSWAGDEQ